MTMFSTRTHNRLDNGRATALLSLLAFLALFAPSKAQAATACLVLSRKIPPYEEASKGFRAGFSGKVTDFDMQGGVEGGLAILPKIAAENCDVIGALGSPAAKFLKMRIMDKPLVFAMVLNPQAEGISGSNLTGVHLEPSPQASLAALKRILPNAKRIGVIYNQANSAAYIASAQKAAEGMGLELLASQAATSGEALRILPSVAEKSDVLWMVPDSSTSSDSVFREMLRLSIQRGLPIFALSQKHVSEGALATVATDYIANGMQAGQIAGRVAGGSNPAMIPSEYARKTGWFVNMKTAERMGISIPADIVKEAVEAYR